MINLRLISFITTAKIQKRIDLTKQKKKGENSRILHILQGSLPSEKWRPPTLPHCIAVPSAQAGLTSLFGMGRGGTPPQ